MIVYLVLGFLLISAVVAAIRPKKLIPTVANTVFTCLILSTVLTRHSGPSVVPIIAWYVAGACFIVAILRARPHNANRPQP
ncbi:hypothetical protein CMUST_01420 [Corynebacterium mustelae]|uniref:Uncharacterized protein n=1 Tax=Corynebacterium mustelae TaxID=571915 RepID=A0A0G3GYN0_9CORY|nr:hypothetical protein [Corynebacterium mustelae]AKK04633.1 hypothetical protein CMUST_01420 [Corynebacterium mustelae]